MFRSIRASKKTGDRRPETEEKNKNVKEGMKKKKAGK